MQDKNILVISPDPWGKYYLSKHHYAIELAKHNRVWFLNHINAGHKNKAVQIRSTEYPGLKILDYGSSLKGIRHYPLWLQAKIYKDQQKRICEAIGEPLHVVWSFDPYRFTDWTHFGAQVHIFHPVDLYPSPIELEVAKNADIIFATSQEILSRYESLDRPAFFINHGLAGNFVNQKAAALHLKGQHKIKAGYSGNLAHRHLATKLLLRLCKRHDQVDFYFIGPKGEGSQLSQEKQAFIDEMSKLSNVHFIASMPYHQVWKQLIQLDLLLICYDRENFEDAPPNPHKMLEYLSTGKAILSNHFQIYEEQKELIVMARSLAEYEERFEQIIAHLDDYNREEVQEQRRTFAAENSYEKQLHKIFRILDEHKLTCQSSSSNS